MSTGREDVSVSARWRWVIGCFISGGILIGLAFAAEAVRNLEGVAPSVLANAGVALGLAGILFHLERRFTGQVVRASERAVQHAAERVEGRMQERTEQLSARLDELRAELDQRIQHRTEEQDAKIAAIIDDVSYETITRALTEANRLRAIYEGAVTVPGSHDPGGIALTFSWGEDTDINSERPARPHFDIGIDNVEIEWLPNDPPATVGYRLVEELQRARLWHGEATVDWQLTLHNLQRSLKIAMSSVRRDRHAWHLQGTLIELVSPTCVLTTAGVEYLGQNLVLNEADFPELIPAIFASLSEVAKERSKAAKAWWPERPDAVSSGEWERAIRHGRQIFPRRRAFAPLLPPSRWRPWEGEPDEQAGHQPSLAP